MDIRNSKTTYGISDHTRYHLLYVVNAHTMCSNVFRTNYYLAVTKHMICDMSFTCYTFLRPEHMKINITYIYFELHNLIYFHVYTLLWMLRGQQQYLILHNTLLFFLLKIDTYKNHFWLYFHIKREYICSRCGCVVVMHCSIGITP